MNMKNERPRASVVIIAYNDETHIERAIQSVCNQTERNIEIICVNDGSTDATCEIMRRCAQRDERIRVISQPNSGALGARYTGMRQMTSDYALFLDSDDVFMPEAVETACAAADETGADVLEFGVSLVIDESNPPSKETCTYLEGYFSQEKPVPDTDHGPELIKACFTEQGSVTWNIWNKLYRKELLQKAYQFYQGEWVCLVEDTLLTLMVLCQAEHYARIPTKLYAYTIGGGISTTEEKLSSESELKQAAAVGLTIKLAREWMTKLGCTQDAAVSGLEALTDSLRAGILDQILYRVAEEKRNEYFSLLSQNCEKNDFFDLISEAVFRQQRQIECLEESRRHLEAQNRCINEMVETQKAHTEQLEAQNGSLVESMEQLEAQNRDLAEAAEARQTRIEQLEAQNGSLVERMEQFAEENRQLRESFNTISNAELWKMTAPMRKVLDTVKMTQFGHLTHEAARCWRTQGFRAMSKKVWAYSTKRHGLLLKVSLSAQEKHYTEECGDREAYSITSFLAACETSGAVYGRELLSEMTGRDRVLFVSHEAHLTGAPIALMRFAEDIKKRGMAPVFITPSDGKLKKKLLDEGIPVIIYSELYGSDLISRAASCFKLIVVNTIVGGPLISRLGNSATPVLWWIHEAKTSYYQQTIKGMPEQLGDNIHVYCVGQRAEKWMHLYRNNYKNDILLYGCPDLRNLTGEARSVPLPPAEGKTVFLTVGTLQECKGQDILTDAIAMLPEKELKKCQFLFVGKEHYQLALDKIRRLENLYPENVSYLGEMDIADMPAVYQNCDCLICSSRDDMCPTTVTEALSLSKIVICSENAGQAVLLKREHSGLVYPNDDPKALSESILYVLHNKENLGAMQIAARKTYESHFSEGVFAESVSKILTQLFKAPDEPEVIKTKVSVIIPVWNGGEDLKRLLGALKAQLGVESIETVIVDSGSSDQSVAYAESNGAKVIQIPHAEFSHSYARNLGAQHASGEYLLFMTQDACPSGPYWLRRMLRPILHQGVTAVSCREEPRPGCDLLGRVNIFIQYSYLEVLQSDRIMQMPENVSTETLRKNAQLSDLACLIRKDVFEQYRHRRNYAEDLDLGLRLIRDGHRLAMLSSAHVIHSHTRPAIYHFKRAIVEVNALSEMLPGSVGGSCPEQYTINRTLTAYCVTKLYVQAAREYRLAGDGRDEWKCFREWTVREIDSDLAAVRRMSPKERKTLIESDHVFSDADYRTVILEMLNILKGDFAVEATTVNEIRHYLVNILDSYFAYAKEPFSASVAGEICILSEKLTGLFGGNLVGTYFVLNKKENSELRQLAQRYAQGV